VLPGTEHYGTYYLVDDTLSLTLPEGAKESEYKRVYIGYDAGSQLKGVAVSRGESGFQDVVQLIFGFDPATGKLLGMKVLDSKETPGLGDKIFKKCSIARKPQAWVTKYSKTRLSSINFLQVLKLRLCR